METKSQQRENDDTVPDKLNDGEFFMNAQNDSPFCLLQIRSSQKNNFLKCAREWASKIISQRKLTKLQQIELVVKDEPQGNSL